jgi:hypothetical protein
MRKVWLIWIFLVSVAQAQEREWVTSMEDQAMVSEGREVEEELDHLDFWRRRKISLNRVSVEELMIFPFLTAFQAEQLILYRKLLGDLVDVYELQAVPGWDAELIRKMLPYVTVADRLQVRQVWKASLQQGVQQLIVRSSLKAGAGVLARYQFRSPVFQLAWLLEKDAGEKWWQGSKGISFLSGHAAIGRLGVVRHLILGDFSVSMGQGLVMGLGRSVRKSGMPMLVKRQQAFLQPYRSSDENRFFRGLGVWLGGKRWEAGWFISRNRLDANLVEDSVTGSRITSLLTSGLHRTSAELADKNVVTVQSLGAMAALNGRQFRMGIHGVWHAFSLPIQRSDELYNRFALKGRSSAGLGVKLEQTIRNVHLFSEWAVDNQRDPAGVLGIQLVADKRLDLSFVGRWIDKSYRSFWASSFTESSEPSDEKGLFIGMSFRPVYGWQVDSYVDVYRHEWPKYRIHGSGGGMDQLLMVQYRPSKKTVVYGRYRKESKAISFPSDDAAISRMGTDQMQSGRVHIEQQWDGGWTWRSRLEWIRRTAASGLTSRGVIGYSEWFWKYFRNPYAFNGRVMLCETDDYNTRLYAYENDVLYYGLIPAFYGKFIRLSVNMQLDIGEKWMLQLKCAQNFPVRNSAWTVRVQLVWRS